MRRAPGKQMDRRMRTYFLWRAAAMVAFLLSATVLPRGPIAALVCVTAGIVAVLACLGTNAGGPGEMAGSRAQARLYEQIRPPQGDWPPFDPDRVVEGEVVRD